MIVYQNTVLGFKEDVDRNRIADAVQEEIIRAFNGRRIAPSEFASIQNSLGFMERVVRRSDVPDDCGILLEYNIPATNNRIDFIISGKNSAGEENFIIVELKQWEHAQSTAKDGIVETFLGGKERETAHPSYQANSYRLFLQDFNENIYSGYIKAYSCAYLHNYRERKPEPLKAPIYSTLITESPIYLKDDSEKLANFIKAYVGNGKGMDILYKLEKGRIKPSKKLIEHVCSMFAGNQDFILLDEQKVAYELAKDIATNAKEKSVVIITGGPGTGKSVISVNLLGGLLKAELNTVFVAPNAAFRSVLMQQLAREFPRNRIQHLFKGSAGFVNTEKNIYDVIIVDEAHRLKDGTAYQYQGENQIIDIINSTTTTIFFVDEYQMIRPEDIGSIAEIKRVANKLGAKVHESALTAQFRCAGAEGFVNWLDDVLQIKETANYDGWDKKSFEFKIFDDPNNLHKAIKEKHDKKLKARLLAGYAWKWTAQREGNQDAQVCDITVPEFGFQLPWNSRRVGSTWAIDESGINQVGCIHTSQGLEFDYIGVIIGDDLKFDSEKDKFFVDWSAYKDVKGKRGLRDKPEELSKLVRSIYKVLMTRGMKGCYVYFTDKETEKYFKKRFSSISTQDLT
ncbi:MAG: DNA/RNA helicase domain-containing protein [Patescibacteria group bacterium]